MNTPADGLYTIGDIASALGVQPSTVRAYMARQQIPRATGALGRTPYWRPADIEPWIERQRANRRHVGRMGDNMGDRPTP